MNFFTGPPDIDQDAVIIGGGFYGTAIAIHLAKNTSLKKITLVERENALFRHASYHNQGRVHSGYHYPRSFTTAYRSRINSPRFLHDWPQAIHRDFTKLYAIARRNSKVTAQQFERFCRQIGAGLEPASPSLSQLFEPRLIEAVFLAEELSFDANQLACLATEELAHYGIPTLLERQATTIRKIDPDRLQVTLASKNGQEQLLRCRYIFNCTYSGLNQLKGDFVGSRAALKQEITEIALIQPPPALRALGITVMDGPFFSMMPFPARGLHSLSHVRYTPHLHWQDQSGIDPYKKLAAYPHATRVDRMIRDVSRYIPAMRDAKHVESLFEIKTVLLKNEGDDGRPILFEKYADLPGFYSILGGKIDNIYDVLERIDAEFIR